MVSWTHGKGVVFVMPSNIGRNHEISLDSALNAGVLHAHYFFNIVLVDLETFTTRLIRYDEPCFAL